MEDWLAAEQSELLFGTDPDEWHVANEENVSLFRSAKA
jgi:hypothetical protein